jgi:hypothetical protein
MRHTSTWELCRGCHHRYPILLDCGSLCLPCHSKLFYSMNRMVRTTINLVFYNIVRYDTSKKGENAPRGLRIKRASRLFNPPQASLLLRDKDDRCSNLPSASHWLSSKYSVSKKFLFKHHTRLPTSNKRNEVSTPQRRRLINPPIGKHYGSVLEMTPSVRKTTVMGIVCGWASEKSKSREGWSTLFPLICTLVINKKYI